MAIYYFMDKEYGDLIPETNLFQDAEEKGYEDITDPASVFYLDYSEHYIKTKYQV